MVPRVILYREEHSRRVLVQKADFVSAAGITPNEVYRRGGPTDLVTTRAHFTFDQGAGRFTLHSVHPGHSIDEVRAETGFEFEVPASSRHAAAAGILAGPVTAPCASVSPRPIRSSPAVV